MRPSRGFTFLEIMVALAIAGILTAASVGSWKKIQEHMRARGSIFALTQAIRATRSEAIRRNSNVGIQIDFDGKRWRRFIDNTVGTRLQYDSQDTLTGGDWHALNKSATFEILINPEQSAIDGSANLVFLPSGAASTQLSFVGKSGSIVKTVTVVQLTGSVQVR